MNFYIQVYYINFYAIKFLLYEKYGMLQKLNKNDNSTIEELDK